MRLPVDPDDDRYLGDDHTDDSVPEEEDDAELPPPIDFPRPPARPVTPMQALVEGILGGMQANPNMIPDTIERFRSLLQVEAPEGVRIVKVEGGYILTTSTRVGITEQQQDFLDLLLKHSKALVGGMKKTKTQKPSPMEGLIDEGIELLRKHQQAGKLLTRPSTRTRVVTSLEDLPQAVAALLGPTNA